MLWRLLGDSNGLAVALRELGVVALFQRDDEMARRCSEESVDLCRRLGRQWDLALSLHNLAHAFLAPGQYRSALALLEESLSLFRSLQDAWGISAVMGGLGFIAGQQGDFATARARLEETLALRRIFADKWNMAETLNLLGEVMQRQGELEQASKLYCECLVLDHEVGDKARMALVLHHLGVIAHEQQQPERAVHLFAVSAALRDTASGDTFFTFTEASAYAQAIATVRAKLNEVLFVTGWREGQAMTLDEAISYALTEHRPVELSILTSADSPVTSSAPVNPAGLTIREIEVLRLLVQGLTYAQIADQLIVSRRTVNAHTTAIYSKLGVTSRAMATRLAVEQHLV